MPFHSSNNIRYFTFDSLSVPGLRHAVFTRNGGNSPKPWDSLNVGGTVGDDPELVRENYINALQVLDLKHLDVYDVWQVHGSRVVIASSPRNPTQPHEQADAILTNKPGVAVFMRFADCVPIMLYDSAKKVVGIAHAGWKGTVLKVVGKAVQTMKEVYGCKFGDIRAAVGPSIGPHHYEIGEDVALKVRESFGRFSQDFLIERNGSKYFDLWGANRYILESQGVQYIENAGICTACNLADWYSHRGEHGRTGRFGALMVLDN
jgi:YfiH family protein